jgi:drug/metabolite transporter (DMT)-like permease
MEVRRGRSQRHGWGCPDPQSPGRSGAAFVPENPLNDRAICTHEPAQGRPLPDSGNDHSTAPSWRGDLLLLVAVNFMWALKWTLSKVALRELEPVSITLFPMVGAIFLLLPLLRWKLKDQPTYLGVIRKVALRPANLFRFFLLGAFGQVACNVLVTWGLKYIPATDAAVIGLATPIFNAFLAALIIREALSWRLVPSFVFALAGVLLMSGINVRGGGGISNLHYLFGVFLFFIATLGSAFYNAYSKKLLAWFSPAEILFYSYIFVVASLYPYYLLAEQPLSMQRIAALHWQTWCSLVLLSIFVYGLSMVLFLEVLTRRPLAPVAISIYLMTVFGVLISTTTLHEPVTPKLVGGALLVLLSTIFANAGKTRKTR